MADSQDVNLLKRRGRRRLVGAVALVLVAVIVLPMVFDAEPRQNAPAISVRIPSEDDGRFAPKLAPQPSVEKVVVADPPAKPAPAPEPAATAVQKPAAEAAAPKPAAPPPAAKVAPAAKPAPAAAKPAVSKPASPAAAATGKGDFVIQVAALGEDEKVKALVERLAGAKLPYYTEPIAIAKGKVTRVRAGPFATRDAAERALKTLGAMGLKPGAVLERP